MTSESIVVHQPERSIGSTDNGNCFHMVERPYFLDRNGERQIGEGQKVLQVSVT